MQANRYFFLNKVLSGMVDIGIFMLLLSGWNYLFGKDGMTNFEIFFNGNVFVCVGLLGLLALKYTKITWNRS